MAPTTDQLKDLLAKVTPGEWRTGEHDNKAGILHVAIEGQMGYSLVATCYGTTQSMADWYAGAAHVSANATLIALAPTLAAEVVRLREALTKIADEEFVRVGYCQTDIDVQPYLSQLEMQRAARQALDATSEK